MELIKHTCGGARAPQGKSRRSRHNRELARNLPRLRTLLGMCPDPADQRGEKRHKCCLIYSVNSITLIGKR